MEKNFVFRCYTYEKGKHNGFIIVEGLKKLAEFIVSNENDKVITDIGDQLIIKTIGSFLDVVPDQQFRLKFIPYLLKAQGYEDIDEEEFPYCVSILDKDNSPSDNLDNFALLEDAIDFAKHNPGSAVFKETCNTEKDTCVYELVWHPTAEIVDSMFDHTDFIDEDIHHEDGVCPACGSSNIEYWAAEFEDNQIYYPVTCKHCGATFQAWYTLEFSGYENISNGEPKRLRELVSIYLSRAKMDEVLIEFHYDVISFDDALDIVFEDALYYLNFTEDEAKEFHHLVKIYRKEE